MTKQGLTLNVGDKDATQFSSWFSTVTKQIDARCCVNYVHEETRVPALLLVASTIGLITFVF